MQSSIYYLLNKFFMNEIEKEILKYSGNEDKIIFDVGCFRGNFTKNIIKNENKREINSAFFLFDPNPNVKNYLGKMLKNEKIKYFDLALDNTNSEKRFSYGIFGSVVYIMLISSSSRTITDAVQYLLMVELNTTAGIVFI